MNTPERVSIATDVNALLCAQGSTMLATINNKGEPECSYTPFLYWQAHFYILISELAAHTQNLRSTPRASLLIIEDEKETGNLFARKRLKLSISARFMERQNEEHTQLMDKFEGKHGSTVAMLKTLPDFHLIELTVHGGTYIRGFGQAFQFDQLDFDHARQVTGPQRS